MQMHREGPEPTINRPQSIWRRIKPARKKLIAASGNGLTHRAVGKWDDLARDGVEALGALNLRTDAQQLAWLLVKAALLQADFELTRENQNLLLDEYLDAGIPIDPGELADAIEATLMGSPEQLAPKSARDRSPSQSTIIALVPLLAKPMRNTALR